MLNLKGKHGSKQSTLHQQLLQSHLRVAGLAAIAFVLVAVAMQLLNNPIKSIQSVNIPTANAAMTIQLGLQRSAANLRGWVALKESSFRENVDHAWEEEIRPAFESLNALPGNRIFKQRQILLSSLDSKLNRLKRLQAATIAIASQPETSQPGSNIARNTYQNR